MNSLVITYIDDRLDKFISKFLRNLQFSDCVCTHHEITFKKDTYKSLLDNPIVKEADILLIDNALFENRNSNNMMFGDELKLIFKLSFPYKVIFTVTQKEYEENDDVLYKYRKNTEYQSITDYYSKEWTDRLFRAAKRIWQNKEILDRIGKKEYIDEYYYSRISSVIDGNSSYSSLSVNDINKLVLEFERFREHYDK